MKTALDHAKWDLLQLVKVQHLAGPRALTQCCAGVNVRDLRQASLRQNVAVVPQDTVLFNDTIFNNVAYGRPGADAADVLSAARARPLIAPVKG